MSERKLYVYKVKFIDLYDGDTFEVVPDLGFGISFDMPGNSNWRLRGWDTPEFRGETEYEKEKALEAKEYVQDWFIRNEDHIYMRSYKYNQTDSLNRWLAEVWSAWDDDAEPSLLGMELYDKQLATEWPTRWRDVYGVTE